MRAKCFRTLPILILSGFLAATILPAYADPAVPAGAPDATPTTDPQIVRLSYVEGDVRVARGRLAEKLDAKEDGKSTGWEQAVTNLPIESGYSIVTGTGRAEIEFEDASTVYLADNSVLIFTELTSTDGVPYTEIALLSGTATMNVHPMVEGEWFKVTTPTDTLSLSYPRKAVWRIDSFLDAVSITPQRDPSITKPELVAAQASMIGKTSTYTHGARELPPATAPDPAASAEWDAWVAKRLTARTAAMTAAMKDAGLSSPIPGLAEMNGQGHFFACAPYGTCWEPTNGWRGQATDVAQVTTQPSAASPAPAPSAQTPAAATQPGPKAAKVHKPSASAVYLAAHPGATLYTEDFFFPCNTFAVQDVIAVDPVTGKQKVIDTYFDLNAYMDGFMYPMMYPGFGRFPHQRLGLFMSFDLWGPWDWAICHSGSWIRWQHHYVWVAGSHRHHECPVHWVRNGRTVGFVPIHPHDVAGKPPINLKDGLFKLTGKKGEPVARVAFDPGKPVTRLDQPPREFRKPQYESLKTVDVPRAEAHSAFVIAHAGNVPLPSKDARPVKGTSMATSASARNPEVIGSQTKAPGTPIIFDRKSQSFSVARQVNEGGRPVTITEPLGPRVNSSQAGFNNNSQVRGASTGYSNPSNSSRSYTPSPSYNGGNSSPSYAPSQQNNGGNYNNGNSTRSYSPPPTYSAPPPTYSAPPPTYSPPPPPPPAPVQTYSPPPTTATPSGPVGH